MLRSALTAHFRSLGTCKGCQGHIITRLDDVVRLVSIQKRRRALAERDAVSFDLVPVSRRAFTNSRDIVPEQTAASVRLARFMGNSTEPGACCSHARIHVRIVDEDLRPLIGLHLVGWRVGYVPQLPTPPPPLSACRRRGSGTCRSRGWP